MRYLCLCKKDRSSDEMISWINHASQLGNLLPVMPEYALDMDTAEGQKKGAAAVISLRKPHESSPSLKAATGPIWSAS